MIEQALSLAPFISLPIFCMVQAVSFIKKRHHTDGMEIGGVRTPETDYEECIWNAIDKVRTDTGEDETIIIRYDLDQVIGIDHYRMTYSRTRLGLRQAEGKDIDEEPLETNGGVDALNKSGTKLNLTPTIKVTVCEEEKVINGWLCRKYIQEMYGMKQEIWATEEIAPAIQPQIKISPAAQQQIKAMFEQPTKADQDETQAELAKIRGFEILTISEVMNTKTTSEVLEIEEIEVKDDVFEAPDGYLCIQDDFG